MQNDNSTMMVWLVAGVAALIIVAVVFDQIRKMGKSSPPHSKPSEAPVLRTEKSASGLQNDILQEGTGEGARNGDKLTVEYTVWLTTGEKIDSSYDRGKPMTFKLGFREVIDGWDKSLKGAKVGEKRKITVPAELAYGNGGQDRVPPGSTLVFEVEVINIAGRRS